MNSDLGWGAPAGVCTALQMARVHASQSAAGPAQLLRVRAEQQQHHLQEQVRNTASQASPQGYRNSLHFNDTFTFGITDVDTDSRTRLPVQGGFPLWAS